MDLMVNPVITDFQQDVNGDIKMLKLGANKEDAWANIAEQGSSAKLDNNKAATIDVSTYTEPVVITPTSGKDGMKKATVTLSNIPSTDSITFYAWFYGENNYYYTLRETPSVGDKVYGMGYALGDISPENPGTVITLADDTLSFSHGGGEVDATRDNTKDIVFTVS